MSRRGWLLFVAMSVIWGVPYLLIKVADDGGVSVPVLVFTRVALGALLLLPAAVRGGHLRALKGHVRWLAATGSGDRLTPVRWAGLAVGLGGVALLAGRDAGHGDALPVIEVLLTALGYAIGPLIANRKLAGLPPVAVNAVCLATAAVVYAPFAALTWPHAVPSAKVLGALAGLGVICTAAAFLLFFALIAEVGPARATVITYVNPAVAVALGALVLGERLTPLIGVSFVLILGGSVLATRAGSGRAHPPAPPPQAPEVVQDCGTTVRSE